VQCSACIAPVCFGCGFSGIPGSGTDPTPESPPLPSSPPPPATTGGSTPSGLHSAWHSRNSASPLGLKIQLVPR